MKKDKNKNFEEEIEENVTMYGEFVSSYFAWVPPEKQKKRAKELDEKTKRKKQNLYYKNIKIIFAKASFVVEQRRGI